MGARHTGDNNTTAHAVHRRRVGSQSYYPATKAGHREFSVLCGSRESKYLPPLGPIHRHLSPADPASRANSSAAATAHKLARLIYIMLTKGEEYTDQGQAYDEESYRERVLRQLNQRANKMGMKLVAAEQPA